ncbi:LysM peptidoglycan-binding domain-containing protein [Iodobacter ciconiae]|uniref:LysM peptidoglycan-binding domain-containing protein n=1 Tax=Iodobacter ciconiae TaxID=2496266 RepID=UPI0013DF3C51|nr:LysM peptidoglycan-binding domain-containing protein [Iodobacter ciconiae]
MGSYADTTAPAKLDYQLHNPSFTPQDDTYRTIDALFSEVVSTPEYADLWARVRTGFTIPELDHQLVSKWENYYASRPEYLNRIIKRGTPYLYYVVNEVEKRGMPMEIALLPMIESAFNPRAESSVKAAGMWQFMPATGKDYGLERTWWYDGRRDVVAATSAALDYLSGSYNQFGDWQLALASYNWGPTAVARAVAKNEAASLGTQFIDLRTPDETRNYVPKLLAVRNIIANPDAYGVTLESLPNKPYFATLTVGKHMDVKVAAELAETPVEELLKLNPGFIRPVIAYKDDRSLVLPIAKVAAFQKNLASYDKPLLNWQPYVTKQGESFEQLASAFGVAASELKEINDIGGRERTARGQTILVPKITGLDVSDRQTLMALAANRAAEPVDTGANDKPHTPVLASAEHKVIKGDTAYNIAKRYGMNVDQLQSMNKTANAQIKIGQVLRVSARPGKIATGNDGREYIAKRGDTFTSISKRYKVATADLKKWNSSKSIQAGTKLVIY